jgi:hypothetical protein
MWPKSIYGHIGDYNNGIVFNNTKETLGLSDCSSSVKSLKCMIIFWLSASFLHNIHLQQII